MVSQAEYKILENGEELYYLKVPTESYSGLKKQLKKTSHIMKIDKMEHLDKMKGYIINTVFENDGLTAITLLHKKLEKNNLIKCEQNPIYFDNGMMTKIPIVEQEEFIKAYSKKDIKDDLLDATLTKNSTDQIKSKPHWYYTNVPIIVETNKIRGLNEKIFSKTKRIIYILNSEYNEQNPSIMQVNFFKRLMFDFDFGKCDISKPTDEYFKHVLLEAIKDIGYECEKEIDIKIIIQKLKIFKEGYFKGHTDIVRLVNRVSWNMKKTSGVMTEDDFLDFLSNEEKQKEKDKNKKEEEFKNMIGLKEVKNQLIRITNHLSLLKERRRKTIILGHSHNAMVFIGNPGTAKTTMARYFSDMLYEKNVLPRQVFKEVTRKDLVAQYVGWTAPKVMKVFEEAHGGILFIDEAYSLMGFEGKRDVFAEEALTEIIAQMENNPETMVIFAGYKKEMRDFINNSNAGMKSRITHIVEFPDYTDDEMHDIFHYLVEKEKFKIEKTEQLEHVIINFLKRFKSFGSSGQGNGRLMRKLLKASVAFMAERENDLSTLTIEDVEKAICELEKAEEATLEEKPTLRIGFVS